MKGWSDADLQNKNFVKDENGNWKPKESIVERLTKFENEYDDIYLKVKSKIAQAKKEQQSVYWKNMTLVDVFKWCEENNYIYIPSNVPSSKNSRINFQDKSGKQRSIKSKLCAKYIKETDKYFTLFRGKFKRMIEGKEKPYRVEFTFIRDSHRAFDYINPCQMIQDTMTANNWLEDDNVNIILPSFGLYGYDKKIPGVIIKVL